MRPLNLEKLLGEWFEHPETVEEHPPTESLIALAEERLDRQRVAELRRHLTQCRWCCSMLTNIWSDLRAELPVEGSEVEVLAAASQERIFSATSKDRRFILSAAESADGREVVMKVKIADPGQAGRFEGKLCTVQDRDGNPLLVGYFTDGEVVSTLPPEQVNLQRFEIWVRGA